MVRKIIRKKLLTPKQAKIYVELRKFGASPTKARNFIARRVTSTGKIRRK